LKPIFCVSSFIYNGSREIFGPVWKLLRNAEIKKGDMTVL
jgi:hypothetical protein